MNIHFWGVRGSLATPLTNKELEAKIEAAVKLGIKSGISEENQVTDFVESLPWHIRKTMGGDTTCVEIIAGDKLLIMDAGTGIRPLGLNLMQRYYKNTIEAHILLSHTHWDHICGIPFFVPAYIPTNTVMVYGSHPNLEERIRNQQDFKYFPAALAPAFRIVQLSTNEPFGKEKFKIGAVDIETIPLHHPGGSFGYKISRKGKTVVFATDAEYKELSIDALQIYVDFFNNADLVIFDAQYTFFENFEKEDWGHSNVFTGIDIALKAGVKKLVFTHHEPTDNDMQLLENLQKAREYLETVKFNSDLQLDIAFEGLSIKL
jgi:phosphoribosyl 1,2-cyclic phosphodiesterase